MKPLVIFEMANNHMGNISHAKSIITKYYQLTKKFKSTIDFAIKFQYRDSETFIHESVLSSNDKQVQRFKTTFFSRAEWKKIITFSKNKFTLVCTPFDEVSVENVIKDKFDYLKIASCSATDWPLLETVAKKIKKRKIICSLGGANEDEISNVISFFSTRNLNARFLYCVAKYPTTPKDLNLIYFQELKKLYGDKIAGISLHEDPKEFLSGAIGYSMGARVFEKHIGLTTRSIKLNKYSVNLNQMEKWLDYLNMAIEQVGDAKERDLNVLNERKQLQNFQRGVYLKKNIEKKADAEINFKNVGFHFPLTQGQLSANNYSMFSDFKTNKSIGKGKKLLIKDIKIKNSRGKIVEIRNRVRDLAARANVLIPKYSRVEISHHYGLEKFYKFGLSMIVIVNKSYCKKYLFLFKNQVHPEQFHKKKKETFLILFGKIKLNIAFNRQKKEMIMKPGEVFTIEPGMIHAFKALSSAGAVIEEISTESIRTDSYYLDDKITKNKNRKSLISFH
jgi:N-acetylneuraminate synthase